MNEFDDLDRLEREFGPALRLALRRVAADIPDDASAWSPAPISRVLDGEQVGDVDERDVHTMAADDLARERHPRRRFMLMAAATIVVLALGLLAVAAVEESDSVQTDTVPPTPVPSTIPATTSSSSTTGVPETTLLAPIETAPETTTPTTNPAVSTTTLLLPLRLDPSLRPDLYGSAGTVMSLTSEELNLAFAVLDVAGWHGQGHDIMAALDADGIIDAVSLGQGGEPIIGCAEWQLISSHFHQFLERAAEARSTLILAGTPEAEITPQRVVSQMTIDDPAVFDVDPIEHKHFLLICGGIPDEQARVIASM